MGGLPKTQPGTLTLDLDFPPPELLGNTLLLFRTPCLPCPGGRTPSARWEERHQGLRPPASRQPAREGSEQSKGVSFTGEQLSLAGYSLQTLQRWCRRRRAEDKAQADTHGPLPRTPGWAGCDTPQALLAVPRLNGRQNKGHLIEITVLRNRSLPQFTKVLVIY